MITSINNAKNELDFSGIKLKDIVTQNFHSVRLFEKHGIDFCCNGNRTLTEALIEKKISEKKFIEELKEITQSVPSENQRFTEWELTFLSDFIVNNHHAFVKNAIPGITAHLQKVCNAHGSKYQYLAEVQDIFARVAEEMINHMMKEERILFPIVKYLVESQKLKEKPKTSGYGTIKNPIRQMEAEHVSAGSSMGKIRTLTQNYSLPSDACTTFQIAYKELDEFEKDLHKHVHLENNILFPKAIELEERLVKGIF